MPSKSITGDDCLSEDKAVLSAVPTPNAQPAPLLLRRQATYHLFPTQLHGVIGKGRGHI